MDDVSGKSTGDIGGGNPCRASGLVLWHIRAVQSLLRRVFQWPSCGENGRRGEPASVQAYDRNVLFAVIPRADR